MSTCTDDIQKVIPSGLRNPVMLTKATTPKAKAKAKAKAKTTIRKARAMATTPKAKATITEGQEHNHVSTAFIPDKCTQK